MSDLHWWDQMAADVEAAGHEDRFSADWYRAMRDLYRERFPNADQRSLDNMDMFVTRAEIAECGRCDTAGRVECWNPGGPCLSPNEVACDTCGPCSHALEAAL